MYNNVEVTKQQNRQNLPNKYQQKANHLMLVATDL
jgi:hypothetical protein